MACIVMVIRMDHLSISGLDHPPHSQAVRLGGGHPQAGDSAVGRVSVPSTQATRTDCPPAQDPQHTVLMRRTKPVRGAVYRQKREVESNT